MSRHRVLGGLLGALVLLIPAPPLRAGGFEIPQQGAAAAGTGSAGVARSGEPAAAWFNPAGLTDGGGFRLELGGALAFPTIKAEAADGSWSDQTEFALSTPAYVYLSFAYAKWATGVSFNVPFASGIKWPEDWVGRFESIRSQPMFFRLAPFFAYRFGPVALSAGVHVDIGRVDTFRAVDFVDFQGDVRVLLSGVGVGGHAAIFWRVTRWLDLGVTYKSRTKLSLSGDADFTVPDSFVNRAPDQGARADFTLPDKITVGALGRFGPVRALLDVSVTVWDVYKVLHVDFEDPGTDDSDTINDWSTTVAVRAGGEYTPLPWLTVRLGLYYDQSPVPARNLYPSSPDSDRVGFTLGLGARIGRYFSVDLFYDFVNFLGQESTSDRATLARYSGRIHFVGLGLRVTAPVSHGAPIPPTFGARPRPRPAPARSAPPAHQTPSSTPAPTTDDGSRAAPAPASGGAPSPRGN